MKNILLLVFTLGLIIILILVGCEQIGEPINGEIQELPKEEVKETIVEEPVQKKIPIDIENNCIGFLSGDSRETEMIASTGGAWVRPHIGAFVWENIEKNEFRETDDWVRQSQNNKVAILATLWPYYDKDQEKCRSDCEVSREDVFYPIDGHGLPKSRCAPCSYEDYRKFLSGLIERYDGDGIDDMPNLEIPIKYWEIMNEPEMNSRSLTFFKGTQEDYIEILKVSREVIKKECPDCLIVQGGAAGSMETITYWRRIFELNGDDYFDIANNHFVNHGDLETLNVKEYKKLMDEFEIDKPLWITEVEFNPKDPVAVVKGALNAGASKIFFTRFPISGEEWITDKKDEGIDYQGEKEEGVDYQTKDKKEFGSKKLPEKDLKTYKEILGLCD